MSFYNSTVLQLTGEISHLRLGLLKEGFSRPQSEPDVDEMVRKGAQRLASEKGASLEDVSVPMHLDCKFYCFALSHAPLRDWALSLKSCS